MFLKELKDTIKLLVVIILKHIVYKIEKNLYKDNDLEVSDYKIVFKISPTAKTDTIKLLTEVVGPDAEAYHKMILKGDIVFGFSKRGYTYEEADRIVKALKVDPKIETNVITIIKSGT